MDRIEDIKLRFGSRVRRLRNQRGMSQQALAFQCGLDRTYIGSVERGERNISLANIHKIATGLEVQPSELLDGG